MRKQHEEFLALPIDTIGNCLLFFVQLTLLSSSNWAQLFGNLQNYHNCCSLFFSLFACPSLSYSNCSKFISFFLLLIVENCHESKLISITRDGWIFLFLFLLFFTFSVVLFLIVFLLVVVVLTHLQWHLTAFHCLVEVQPKSTKVNALHTVQMTFDLAKCYFCHPHVSRIQLHFTFPGQDLVYMFVCLYLCFIYGTFHSLFICAVPGSILHCLDETP